jgi:hypothetical protein
MQQLLPQVWGLALGAALFALVMRPGLHERTRPSLAELVPVWVLAIALFIVYIELAATLGVSYALYLGLLAVQRRLSVIGVLRLWGTAVLGLILIVNVYLPRAIDFVVGSASAGVTKFGSLNLFANSVVPTALPGILGFQSLFESPSKDFMSLSIIAAAIVLGVVLVAAVVTAQKGDGASVVVVGDVLLGLFLALQKSDFGLFKLYMYVQPFLAAAVGVWMAGTRNRVILGAVAAVVALVVVVQVRTQSQYVANSYNPPDLTHASDADLLPKFRSLLTHAELPVLTLSDNAVLLTLQGAAASAARRRLEFLSVNAFGLPSIQHEFRFPTRHREPVSFSQSRGALELLTRKRCLLAMPSGSQHVLNRRHLGEGAPDILGIDCARARNLLAFVTSSVGSSVSPTALTSKIGVSFWQLERDPSFNGRTLSGFGRYALLQALNPSPGARLELAFSTSSLRNSSLSFRLPRATVTGSTRLALPVAGVGSGRVFSPPLRPQMIGGHAYLLLDMGERGFFPPVPRPGVTGLWGEDVVLDPRRLTSHVRAVSLISDGEYRRLRAPRRLSSFPDDLAEPGLEYSGIYEDGWIGRDSYAHLAAGPRSELVVRADVLPHAGNRTLEVRVDGHRLHRQVVRSSALDLRLRLPASEGRRKIELIWGGTSRLPAPDRRPAVARLTYLGLAAPAKG